MAVKVYGGISLDVTDEGYLNNPDQWTKEVALDIAKEEGLELTETHIKVLEYIRSRFKTGEALTIRGVGKSGIVDIKGFYQLFPGAPMKKAARIAGVPKPASCV
jgi:dissimilatory sulfite reductase related protein